jgi:hypothetical protein
MRITLNVQAATPADLQKALRSAAAKITPEDITPGADVKVGNVRVQVATPKVADIRQFARDNDIPVGTRGRFSKDLQERYAAYLKDEKRKAREARAARKAEREAVSV